ncbi:MAG: SRPBCC family protein [Promethearchaeota archaeon]
MPKLERSIEINAPSSRVREVLTDPELIPKWNITVKEISNLEPNKGTVKSNVGDFTFKVMDQVENNKIIVEVDHPEFSGYGYILNDKEDLTELSYWVDYKQITREKIQARSLNILLNEIKNFTEFLEDGGDPEEYTRKQILVNP